MNSDALVLQAIAFYNAFIVLEEKNAGLEIPRLAAPVLVNGAFSIELSLKTILVKNNVDYGREHNLHILFQLLPLEFKFEIWNFLIEKAPEYKDLDKFSDELLLVSNVFVNWRYCFEQQAPAVNPQFVSAFANAAIRGVFAHYNVNIVEIPVSEKMREEIESKFERNRTQCIESSLLYIRKKNKEHHI